MKSLLEALSFRTPACALLGTLLPHQKITYFDIGARGDTAPPWSSIPRNRIRVIGFEPDPNECARLQSSFPERKYFPYAVWSQAGTRDLYLNHTAATSSLYPTKDYREFSPEFNDGRTLDRIVQAKCEALDNIITIPDDEPDFIKIDTQGAEYEILMGARRLLTEGAPVVAAETWCAEIYAGAPLSFKIEEMMYELGYQVFDTSLAAAWSYHAPTSYNGRPVAIGYNILFVKRLNFLKTLPLERLTAFAYLMELFGYRDYAYVAIVENSVIGDAEKASILEIIRRNSLIENNKLGRMALRILRRLGKADPRYPSIT